MIRCCWGLRDVLKLKEKKMFNRMHREPDDSGLVSLGLLFPWQEIFFSGGFLVFNCSLLNPPFR